MKDKVLTWFAAHNLDPMNTLQELGMVSDNAITFDDVCPRDIGLVHYQILSGELPRLIAEHNQITTK